MFDTVPVRCYNPLINSSTTWAGGTPAIVYFHGGGWVAGSIGKQVYMLLVCLVEMTKSDG